MNEFKPVKQEKTVISIRLDVDMLKNIIIFSNRFEVEMYCICCGMKIGDKECKCPRCGCILDNIKPKAAGNNSSGFIFLPKLRQHVFEQYFRLPILWI